MGMVTVDIRGKKFPLCLTVAALDEINDKCGGLGHIYDFLKGYPSEIAELKKSELEAAGVSAERWMEERLEASSQAKVNNTWILGLLIREGEENRIMEARFNGGDTERHSVPGPEDMVNLLTPGQIEDYRLSILVAVNESLRRTLEATPKNGFQGAEG